MTEHTDAEIVFGEEPESGHLITGTPCNDDGEKCEGKTYVAIQGEEETVVAVFDTDTLGGEP